MVARLLLETLCSLSCELMFFGSRYGLNCLFYRYRDAASRGAPVLAQQVLAEIPNQVLRYMELHKITPNKKA